MHDDFYLELARLHWRDLQREIERDRVAKMAQSVLPPRQPWVWSLLGRAFSAMQPVISRFLSSGMPGVTGRSRGGGRSSASDAKAPSAAPRAGRGVAAAQRCGRAPRGSVASGHRRGRRRVATMPAAKATGGGNGNAPWAQNRCVNLGPPPRPS
jgi:hypothetical protein